MIKLRCSQVSGVYGIDASSIMELDDAHKTIQGQIRRPASFSGTEREAIWSGLEALAEDNRLKLLDMIKGDLDRMYPRVVPKLMGFPNIYVLYHSELKTSISRYSRQTSTLGRGNLENRSLGCDPSLVVAAKTFGWTVISEESPRGQRRSRSKDVPTPDVCSGENVQCFSSEHYCSR